MASYGFYTGTESFYQTITAAVADIAEHGFDSEERLETWVDRIRKAAVRSMVPERTLQAALNETLRSIFRAKVERGGVLKMHPDVSRFTLDKIAPRLRSELDRRIMASASLIRLNRAQAIDRTIQRFTGWATSIPAGGSGVVDRLKLKEQVRKPLASMPFEERRVAIDQGHKLVSSINSILATDGGAIAAEWHSHCREIGYNYRPDHKAIDKQVFLIRDSWAHQAGFVKAPADRFTDKIEQPAGLPFCRCYYRYVYALRSLYRIAPEMFTAKGLEELERVKVAA